MTLVQGDLANTISSEIAARPEQVEAAVDLLDGGSTVPFIARYRKEATGGLDDGQLRKLEERLTYLRELAARREAIVSSIETQGKMTDELAAKIEAASTKAALEDLYLPYKPKRRTRAQIAIEHGLLPLAETLLADRSKEPETEAAGYVGDDVPDIKTALEGARDILAEQFSEHPDLVGRARDHLMTKAMVRARVVAGKEEAGEKYRDYFAYDERWAKVPSHRALALFRARKEGVLNVEIVVDEDDSAPVKPIVLMIAETFGIDKAASDPASTWLMSVVRWTWQVKLSIRLSTDLMVTLRERAEEEAIRVFSHNLKDLLLAAPAGARTTIGLDPGIRTGVKVAVVDGTGKLLETATIYPFQPRNDVKGAKLELLRLVSAHGVDLIAIGNGTASRETDDLVAEIQADLPDPKPTRVMVSEAGASVYSASAIAAAEMPDIDVTLRGAVSIARRLQDPLAELVKIEPNSIGVGQYQHDVDQKRLARGLDAVVEDAVNAVGVELNTASAPLLSRVSGVGPGLAETIVAHRNDEGPFKRRRDLKKVPRLGDRAFELCAGFLRIRDGDEPLDASAVHPEAYPVAARIVAACGRDMRALTEDGSPLKTIKPADFADGRFGLPTVRDIIAELEKPGRDPRPEFKTGTFAEGIHKLDDLETGMVLEGTVSNVAAFGAFVDIGVHQDGLVHVSHLADRFVKDPSEIVKAGDVVQVRVLEVDVKRKRISLSMRSEKESSDKR
ncbi:MAG: Tex family protein, partial [Geminicoccaceae bacterium]